MNKSKSLCMALAVTWFLFWSSAHTEQLVDLQAPSTSSLLKGLEPQTLHIERDPLYKRSQSYVGYSMDQVSQALGFNLRAGSALRFHCRDGYKAVLAVGSDDLRNALLISKALTGAAGYQLGPIMEGKEAIDPGPFLVVWRGNDSEGGEFNRPRPYSIVAIEHGSVDEFLGRAYPLKDPQALPGFALFQSKCMACHSVNMQGGTLGPEMNVPKNITEYWSKEHFFGLVANPQEYRYKSRMNSLGLSQEEIQSIYYYLKSMRDQKICSSLAECRSWDSAH